MTTKRLYNHDTDRSELRQRYATMQLSAAEREYRAAVNALSAEYKAAQAAGDTQRAAEIKAAGVALVNARYGL